MSVVVAIKKDGKVYIGADSQTTRGSTRSSLTNPNNYKIWKVNGCGHTLMAHVGRLRDACVVRVMSDLVREIDDIHDVIDYEYVVDRIFPMIVRELMDRKYIDISEVFDGLDSRFIFAHRDKLFLIGSDGSVLEIDDCVAIGSGESEAIGSLITTEKEQNPVTRIVKAIKSSAAHDIYVDYPIIITDTESMEFNIITEKNETQFLKHDEKNK
jgi:ATP-dependent protease HslVU (ClpYQ) peptidase subunit